MGVEKLLMAGGLLSGGISIFGGAGQKSAYRSEASLLEEEGRLLREDQLREATDRATEIRKAAAKQKLAYLRQGVRLSGSPLLALDETLTEGQREVDLITERGNRLFDLKRRQADILRSQGRSSLVGGFGQALSTLLGIGTTLYAARNRT